MHVLLLEEPGTRSVFFFGKSRDAFNSQLLNLESPLVGPIFCSGLQATPQSMLCSFLRTHGPESTVLGPGHRLDLFSYSASRTAS